MDGDSCDSGHNFCLLHVVDGTTAGSGIRDYKPGIAGRGTVVRMERADAVVDGGKMGAEVTDGGDTGIDGGEADYASRGGTGEQSNGDHGEISIEREAGGHVAG